MQTTDDLLVVDKPSDPRRVNKPQTRLTSRPRAAATAARTVFLLEEEKNVAAVWKQIGIGVAIVVVAAVILGISATFWNTYWMVIRIDGRLKPGDPNNLAGTINRNSEQLTALSDQVSGVVDQLDKRFGKLTALIRGLHRSTGDRKIINEELFPGPSASALLFQDESRLVAVTPSDTPRIARLIVESSLEMIPVHLPRQGEVVSTFVDETMCRQVIVAHDLGFRTQFGHLRAEDEFKKVKVGQVLEPGDILGVIKASSPAWVTATVFLPGSDTPLLPEEFFPSLQATESYLKKPK